MLLDESERLALVNFHLPARAFFSFPWETKGAARLLDTRTGDVRDVLLRDERMPAGAARTDELLSVVEVVERKEVRITARPLASPARWVSRIAVSDLGISFEGETDVWKRLPRTYDSHFTFRGSDYEYLLVVDVDSESVDVQRLDWYNEDTYDMGYQGLMGVTEIPGSDVVILPVQRDSNPILYDTIKKTIVGKISLADRHGNPEIQFRRKALEAWASDYDTLLKLKPGEWQITNQLRLQGGTKKLVAQFIGNFAFNKDESLCAVARPFSGDIVAVDTERLEVTYLARVGHEPLDVALLSDGRVFARDWRTPRILHGELHPAVGFDPIPPPA